MADTLSEADVLRRMVAQLDSDHGPHPEGSYEVWALHRQELLARINAQAVFALEEMLAKAETGKVAR